MRLPNHLNGKATLPSFIIVMLVLLYFKTCFIFSLSDPMSTAGIVKQIWTGSYRRSIVECVPFPSATENAAATLQTVSAVVDVDVETRGWRLTGISSPIGMNTGLMNPVWSDTLHEKSVGVVSDV